MSDFFTSNSMIMLERSAHFQWTKQRAILDNASRYVRPGGVLLYATCTILPEENGEITDGFLACHGEFQKEPFSLPGLEGETDGSMCLWPQRHGTDGFYICKMRRL